MKINKSQLQQLIQEVAASQSVLLEQPRPPIIGQEQTGHYTKNSDEYEGEDTKRSLFHMSSQAQQLHDMIGEDEKLEPWARAAIVKATDNLEKVFKSLMYDKQNPRGH